MITYELLQIICIKNSYLGLGLLTNYYKLFVLRIVTWVYDYLRIITNYLY